MTVARVFSAAVVFCGVAGLGAFPCFLRAADPAKPQHYTTQTVGEVNFDGIPLIKAIDFFRTASGINIVVNWKTLEAAGVTRDTPITLQVRDLSFRKMLQLVLSQASPNAPLAYSIDSNVLTITTQEELDKQLITKVYIVDDLVMVDNTNIQPPRINLNNIGQSSGGSYGSGGGGFGGGGSGYGGNSGGGSGGFGGNSGGGSSGNGFFTNTNTTSTTQNQQTSAQKGQQLVDLIKAVIRPNIWKDNGGPADIKYLNGKLIVTAPVSVQEAIGGPVGNSGIRLGM